ncbi:hypothetical protein D9M68_706070 [compost metagenome]
MRWHGIAEAGSLGVFRDAGTVGQAVDHVVRAEARGDLQLVRFEHPVANVRDVVGAAFDDHQADAGLASDGWHRLMEAGKLPSGAVVAHQEGGHAVWGGRYRVHFHRHQGVVVAAGDGAHGLPQVLADHAGVVLRQPGRDLLAAIDRKAIGGPVLAQGFALQQEGIVAVDDVAIGAVGHPGGRSVD